MSNELLREFQETLTRFKEDENKWENHTKAEYIKRCAELVEAQIKENIINIEISGISSYLYKKLSDFGISCSQRTIQQNLPSDLKRNYFKSETLSHLSDDWEEIQTEDESIKLEKDQYGHFKINGEQLTQVAKPREPKYPTQTKEEPDTRQYVYLEAMRKLANKFELTLKSLKDRYANDPKSKEIIDKELGDVEKKLQDYAQMWANIENSKGMIDLRRDWGEYEKVMGTFMIETGETIARIAQLMDYSEKYGSIGLLREPKIREFFENPNNYPLFLRSCPACLKDISQIMNKNITLYRECKDLSIEIPTIKYNL